MDMAFKIKRIQALQKERELDTEEREHCAGVRLASRNVTVGRSSDVDLGFPHSPNIWRGVSEPYNRTLRRIGVAAEFFDNLA
jgi:hypothetical protein